MKRSNKVSGMEEKETEFQTQLRLTTQAGTLEIANADREVLDHMLRVMLHAE